MAYFRKKPVVIEAFRINQDKPPEWWRDAIDEESAFSDDGGNSFVIHTLEGDMRTFRGDWIIRGTKGELYPCKPDIFETIYEPVWSLTPDIGGAEP